MVDLNELRSIAARVAFYADLRDVRLFNVKADLDQFPEQPGGLSYGFESKVEVQYVADTPALIVDGTYDLTVTFTGQAEAEDQAAEEEQVAKINFQIAALYAIESPYEGDSDVPDFPDEELDAFGKTTGMLALHPYAREFIANITGRMGLPTLHVGTAKIPLDKRNDHD